VVGTGNGAIGVVTADTGAAAGQYEVVIVSPAADGGAFQVIRPDGSLDGAGNVGSPYNGAINFTLSDGSADNRLTPVMICEPSVAAGSHGASFSITPSS